MKSVQHNLAGADQEERNAKRLFARYCFPNRQRFCPRCRSRRVYLLRDDRRRCAKCRYTFSEFSGRWLASMNFSCTQWLRFLELFARHESAYQIARSLDISYPTATRAVFIIRQAILTSHAANILVATHPHAVWGITQNHDRVIIRRLPDLDPEKALFLPIAKSVRAGTIYTNPWQHPDGPFDSLVFRPTRNVLGLKNAQISKLPLAIDRLAGFWHYVRTNRTFWRQVGTSQLGLYWGEHAFRFNHRDSALLPILLQSICALLPPTEPAA
ncbi:MAG TPA: transposase [Phycisphaerae bacterium]|nr:transposase [Phycisphaerae bacterium]